MAQNFEFDVNKIMSKVETGAEKGIKESGEKLMELSKLEMPVLTGNMKNKTTVSQPTPLVSQIGSSADYTTKVHENLFYHHPRGGKAKFFTDPLYSNSHEFVDIIGNAVMNELKNGW